MFKIGKFISEIQTKGVLRSNKFLVYFNAPIYLSGGSIEEQLSLRCESVQMPGMTFAEIEGPPRPGVGPTESIPFNVVFESVTLTFVIDAHGDIHRFFDAWCNSIVNYTSRGQTELKNNSRYDMSPYEVNYKDHYVTDLSIDVIDPTDQKVLTAKMYRAYPHSLPSFDLNWGSNDELIKLSIPFKFTDMEMKYHSPNTKAKSSYIDQIPGLFKT